MRRVSPAVKVTTPTSRNASGQIRSKAERLPACATDESAVTLGEAAVAGSVGCAPVVGLAVLLEVGFFVRRVTGRSALEVAAGFRAFVVVFSVGLAVVFLAVVLEASVVTEEAPSTAREMEAVLLNEKMP